MRLGSGTVLVGFSLCLSLGACGKDQLVGPKAEVQKTDTKVTLPQVPAFDLPPVGPDGAHSVKELRVKGKKLLDTTLTVKGYVTWVYDCATALRTPELTPEAVQKIIDETPDKCSRPKFYIGDTADTPAEKSLWVVGVPRPYNKSEMKVLKKKDRTDPKKCEPGEKDPNKSLCPPVAVGDQVEVTGIFSTSASTGEFSTDGLVNYDHMTDVTKSYTSPAPPIDPNAPVTPAPAPGAKPSPQDLVNPH